MRTTGARGGTRASQGLTPQPSQGHAVFSVHQFVGVRRWLRSDPWRVPAACRDDASMVAAGGDAGVITQRGEMCSGRSRHVARM